MDEIARLTAVEEIKRLKALYFRAMDTKQWAQLEDVFTVDARCDFRGALHDPAEPVNEADDPLGVPPQGRAAIIAVISEGLASTRSVHHGHMPEIIVESAEHARGIWTMEDRLTYTSGPFREIHGFGHYHETYRFEAGKWRIATLRLTRLRVDKSPA